MQLYIGRQTVRGSGASHWEKCNEFNGWHSRFCFKEPDIRHAQIDYSQCKLIIYRFSVFTTYRVVTGS